MSIHEKAIRLAEGGIVEIDGYFVRAVQFFGNDTPCNYCEMDCICGGLAPNMTELCEETFSVAKHNLILKLLNNK